MLARLAVASAIFLALLSQSLGFSHAFAQADGKQAYKKGQAVEVEWGNKWWPAKILALKPNGGARVSYDGWSSNFDEDVTAERIRPLAGAPAAEKEKPKTDAELRTWTDASGKFKIEARFVKQEGDRVELERKDGKAVKLPFAKLSAADQDYVKKLASEDDADNPFKTAETEEESPFKAADGGKPTMPKRGDKPFDAFGNADEDKIKITPASAAGASELIIEAPSSFAYTPDPAPSSSNIAAPNRALKLSALPPEEGGHNGMFDKVKAIFFDPAKSVFLVAHMNEHPGKLRTTRFDRLDLAKGTSLGVLDAPVNFAPLDYDLANQRLLGRSDNFHFGTRDRLDIWQLGDTELTHQVSFKPYGGNKAGGWKDVAWARFIGPDHVATFGGPENRFVLWETKGLKPVYAATLWAGCEPALSGGGKYVAVVTKDGTYVLEGVSGNVVAQLTGQIGYFPKLSFRPDGKQLACASNDHVTVWDMTTGKVASEVYYPQPSPIDEILWPADGTVALRAAAQLRLIDLDKKVVLWNYQVGEGAAVVGGRLWSAVNANDGAGRSLVHTQIPDAKAKEMQTSLAGQDVLVLKPGAKVSVFINVALGEPERVKIYNHILAQLKEAGIEADQSSKLSIEAATEAGETEKVNYQTFGPRFGPGGESANVTKTVSRLTIRENGKVIWEAKQIAGAPHFINQKQGQSLQDAINEKTGPNVAYFLNQQLPRQLARHPDAGSYGASTLTPQGLK